MDPIFSDTIGFGTDDTDIDFHFIRARREGEGGGFDVGELDTILGNENKVTNIHIVCANKMNVYERTYTHGEISKLHEAFTGMPELFGAMLKSKFILDCETNDNEVKLYVRGKCFGHFEIVVPLTIPITQRISVHEFKCKNLERENAILLRRVMYLERRYEQGWRKYVNMMTSWHLFCLAVILVVVAANIYCDGRYELKWGNYVYKITSVYILSFIVALGAIAMKLLHGYW